jgi:hypothetical protein
MKHLIFSLVLAFQALLYSVAGAQPTNLVQPFTSEVDMFDSNGGHLGRAGYLASGLPWEFLQWNNPSSLVPPANPTSTGWTIANSSSRLQLNPGNVYELAFASPTGICGQEYDLFLQKGGGRNNGFVPSAPLNTLGSIMAGVTVSVPYFTSNPNPPCFVNKSPADYSQYTLAFTLDSSTNQTIFYQVLLGTTRSSAQGDVVWCPEYENASHQMFCLDDDIRNFGGTFVLPGSNVTNTVDVLPRILRLLALNHPKAGYPQISVDPDPSHWYVSGAYLGLITQGQAITTTQWSNPLLSTMPGGSFCSGDTRIQYSCGAGEPSGPGWVNVGSGCYHRNSGTSCTK